MTDNMRTARPLRETISADVPDWSREAKTFWSWQPSRSLLASLRAHERARRSAGPLHAPAKRQANTEQPRKANRVIGTIQMS